MSGVSSIPEASAQCAHCQSERDGWVASLDAEHAREKKRLVDFCAHFSAEDKAELEVLLDAFLARRREILIAK